MRRPTPDGKADSMAFHAPDRYFSRASAIDVETDILDAGFRNVILDVDNTILTRDDHHVPDDVIEWLAKLQVAGVGLCLLSNNFHEGVLHLADRLDLPIVARAVKPLPHGFFMALSKMGAKRAETVVVGDQLMTDVLGAHLAGMKAYLVCPLVEADLKHTLLLRNVERVLLGTRSPEPAASSLAQAAEAWSRAQDGSS